MHRLDAGAAQWRGACSVPSKGVAMLQGKVPPAKSRQKTEPLLATLADAGPSGHELKYEGYRSGCHIHQGAVRLESRNGKAWTEAFPKVVCSAQKLTVSSALFDGEVAIVEPNGRALQNAFSRSSRQDLSYFAFDVLYLEGCDLRPLPPSPVAGRVPASAADGQEGGAP
jgi:bifunctional non-homologous end joining protein LigD